MNDLNKKICQLNNVIDVEVYTSGSFVKYAEPNTLQSQVFGMTTVPIVEHSDNVHTSQLDMEFLARVIADFCNQKGYQTDFLETYSLADKKLKRDEFSLNSEQKIIAQLKENIPELYKEIGLSVEETSYNYPTYNPEKLSDVYRIKKGQVALLSNTFYELTQYIINNGLDLNGMLVLTYEHEHYENKTESSYVVRDPYNTIFESLLKCMEIVYGNDFAVNYANTIKNILNENTMNNENKTR